MVVHYNLPSALFSPKVRGVIESKTEDAGFFTGVSQNFVFCFSRLSANFRQRDEQVSCECTQYFGNRKEWLSFFFQLKGGEYVGRRGAILRFCIRKPIFVIHAHWKSDCVVKIRTECDTDSLLRFCVCMRVYSKINYKLNYNNKGVLGQPFRNIV